MSAPSPSSPAEFQIVDQPLDAARLLYARLGALTLFLGFMFVLACYYGLQDLSSGKVPRTMSLMFFLLGTIVLVVPVLRTLLPKSRRWLVRVGDESIEAQRQTGTVSLRWADTRDVELIAGMLTLAAGPLRIVLPAYRLPATQLQGVRARLKSDGSPSAATCTPSMRAG